MSQAIFGGGCFWCLDAVFRRVEGVHTVVSGYMGGDDPHPTYEKVCRGRTGHAEVVRIDFDPAVVGYGDLLAIFFKIHDPTTLNRQGADTGTQYRSVIFWTDDEQQRLATDLVTTLDADGVFDAKIVTELAPAATFHPAESYHQDYFDLNGTNPYCQAVVAPKVAKFLTAFKERVKRL